MNQNENIINVVIIALIIAMFAGVAKADDWSMFAHDPQRTSYSSEVLEPGFKILWKYKTEGSIKLPPVVFRDTLFASSDDGYLVFV